MRTTLLALVMTLAALSFQSRAQAQIGFPMLMSLKPVAVQTGQMAEVVVNSRYSLHGAYQVLISGSGVTGEVVPPPFKLDDLAKKPTLEKLTVRFTAAADAQPGVRDVRIATPQGVSTVAQLVVVRDPVIAEGPKNDTPDKAQQVSLPAALCGAIEANEDVDYFRFHADAGTSLVFFVRSSRLQDRIHDLQAHSDPIITLRTAAGSTIAASDNDEYHADPLLAHKFEAEGDYLLEVRDVRYQGNVYWEYCIEVSDRPHVTTTFPLAVAAGTEQTLELVGFNLPEEGRVKLTPAAELPPGLAWFDLPTGARPANPVPLVVTNLPLLPEADGANDTLETAQPITIPAGIQGRMEREGDVDYFAFEAKKGDSVSFEVIARRRQSALDSHLRVLDEKGKQLALSDDLRLGKRNHADSWQEAWVAPADGKYVVEVRDVHLRGGPRYPYFLRMTPAAPYFELYIDTDKTQIGPGGNAAIFVRVERKNGFAGEVQLAIDGLPPGVTASCGRILAGKGQDGCIVLAADADAALAASNVVITGTAAHELPDKSKVALSATATPYQETYQPGGGRGHWPVETHTVAVTDYADLRGVSLSTRDITLLPGESKKIEITIDRSPDFTQNVTLDMQMRHLASSFANTLPPGVTLNDKDAKSLLTGKTTTGYLTVTAAKDAPPVEKQQCVVVAHVALNFVMKWTYASPPVTITVAQP
ncbi:MAG: hypothetical protein SFU86_15635 [Pirellulaceae bacterium]|nr:hypothetical protein [Pirellulaceae bacterium]